MSGAGHTPGPWQAVYDRRKDRWHIACLTHVVARLFKSGANARLIAAAPDLLAFALSIAKPFAGAEQAHLERTANGSVTARNVLAARAVIAQATGGAS